MDASAPSAAPPAGFRPLCALSAIPVLGARVARSEAADSDLSAGGRRGPFGRAEAPPFLLPTAPGQVPVRAQGLRPGGCGGRRRPVGAGVLAMLNSRGRGNASSLFFSC